MARDEKQKREANLRRMGQRAWKIVGLTLGVAGQAFAACGAESSSAAPVVDRSVLPIPVAAFQGQRGLRSQDSIPAFPALVKAPSGAPNIVLVMLDDVGFGAASPFGGPVRTRTLEQLADTGLRYNRFHTAAQCSPTRAALLTGRNHHTAHSGVVPELGTGFPGYDSLLGRDTATIAEVLKLNGYSTAMFGKAHNTPDWETSQAGPFDRWPTGQGFEKFYGFLGIATNQWRPAVYEGTKPIEPYRGRPDYHFDDDIADQAIGWIGMQKAVAPEKPFFVYYAPGASHSPLQPRPEWAARYKGKFDQGWDKLREETFARQKKLGVIPAEALLTPRPKEIPAWDSASPEQKRLWSHMMEMYAGFLEQTDYNVGRVLQSLDAIGERQNTLVIYIVGDNGASAEGTLQGSYNSGAMLSMQKEGFDYIRKHERDLGSWKSSPNYPVPWAWAMGTPFQWTKQIASHFGGTRTGLVVSWPAQIKDNGQVRGQFHHVVDIAPTLLEAAHLPQPVSVNGATQRPIEGVSMLASFTNANSPEVRKTQYFEIFANSAIYHDGWIASTTPTRQPWNPADPGLDILTANWELYNVDKDFSQANDLAKALPDKLREMQFRFFAEAAAHEVLPIDSAALPRFAESNRPSLTRGRTTFTYTDGMTRIPEGAAPNIKNRSWLLTVDVTAAGGASGVLATQGGHSNGWALYLSKGRPTFSYTVGNDNYRVSSRSVLPKGDQTLTLKVTYDGGGMGKGASVAIASNGVEVARGRIEKSVPFRFSADETLDFGEDTGTPVDFSYDVPNRFEGKIRRATIELK